MKMKRIPLKIAIVYFGLMVIFNAPAFAKEGSSAADFLCEIGIEYYERGAYREALHELKKALLVEPQHEQALTYIRIVKEKLGSAFAREEAVAQALEEAEEKEAAEPVVEEEPVAEPSLQGGRLLPSVVEGRLIAPPVIASPEGAKQSQEEIASVVLLPRNDEEEAEAVSLSPLEKFDNFVEDVNEKIAPAKISGEYRVAMGVNSEGLTGKFAEAGLAERNWRYLAADQERFNTFDPAIYSRFRLNVETDTTGPLDAYLSLVVDPWSFRGTSRKVDLKGLWPDDDVAEDVQLRYFSSNRRIINETYRTIRGDSLGIPEMKVIDDWTMAESRNSFSWANPSPNTFPIPALEIDREFMPVRKLWFDVGSLSEEDEEGIRLRIFPLASEEQALTTDDPLMLSNRHNYWEPSPWIWDWEQHMVFRGSNALKPGRWSDTLAFRARDTEGYHLTYLRGVSLEAKAERAFFQATVAAPLSPWDDYQIVNNIPGALRLKFYPQEELMLGSTYTFRQGFGGGHKDTVSHTAGIDAEIKVAPEISLKAEAALSKTKADQTSEAQQWQNEDTGQAYKAEFSYTSKDSETSADSLQVKVAGTYMGKDFDAPLSHYLKTREDMFWGEHISFSQPLEAYEPFRIGDGIDVDRYVGELDLRAKLFEERLELLFNLRNVHRASNDKYIETVFRNEGTYRVNPKLTAKCLFINRDLPHTLGNYDPLIVKSDGEPILNYAIEDGLDPSTLTGGLGLKYDFTEKVSLEGIYERSNDLPDFPRALLNDIAYIGTETEGGITYDYIGNQLYQQGIFSLPDYDYFDIYKCKLTLKPIEDLTLRLNYTHNTFKYAGPVDDNINHGAVEADYNFGKDWGLSFRYVYSKFIDVYRQAILGEGIHYDGHHNFYAEARYDIDDNKRLRVQYGTYGYFNPAAGEYSTGWSLATVDTEHLLRIFIDGKF